MDALLQIESPDNTNNEPKNPLNLCFIFPCQKVSKLEDFTNIQILFSKWLLNFVSGFEISNLVNVELESIQFLIILQSSTYLMNNKLKCDDLLKKIVIKSFADIKLNPKTHVMAGIDILPNKKNHEHLFQKTSYISKLHDTSLQVQTRFIKSDLFAPLPESSILNYFILECFKKNKNINYPYPSCYKLPDTPLLTIDSNIQSKTPLSKEILFNTLVLSYQNSSIFKSNDILFQTVFKYILITLSFLCYVVVGLIKWIFMFLWLCFKVLTCYILVDSLFNCCLSKKRSKKNNKEKKYGFFSKKTIIQSETLENLFPITKKRKLLKLSGSSQIPTNSFDLLFFVHFDDFIIWFKRFILFTYDPKIIKPFLNVFTLSTIKIDTSKIIIKTLPMPNWHIVPQTFTLFELTKFISPFGKVFTSGMLFDSLIYLILFRLLVTLLRTPLQHLFEYSSLIKLFLVFIGYYSINEIMLNNLSTKIITTNSNYKKLFILHRASHILLSLIFPFLVGFKLTFFLYLQIINKLHS